MLILWSKKYSVIILHWIFVIKAINTQVQNWTNYILLCMLLPLPYSPILIKAIDLAEHLRYISLYFSICIYIQVYIQVYVQVYIQWMHLIKIVMVDELMS